MSLVLMNPLSLQKFDLSFSSSLLAKLFFSVQLKKIFIRYKNITKTRLFKYIENFTSKNGKFSDKSSEIFHISVQNINCGYSLEPPMILSRNKKNNVYPCKPQFYCIKVGFKGIKII